MVGINCIYMNMILIFMGPIERFDDSKEANAYLSSLI